MSRTNASKHSSISWRARQRRWWWFHKQLTTCFDVSMKINPIKKDIQDSNVIELIHVIGSETQRWSICRPWEHVLWDAVQIKFNTLNVWTLNKMLLHTCTGSLEWGTVSMTSSVLYSCSTYKCGKFPWTRLYRLLPCPRCRAGASWRSKLLTQAFNSSIALGS